MRRVRICDTTLRDSEYVSAFHMSVREKVEIAKQIERLGADLIETGASSDALREIAAEIGRAVFSVACTPEQLSDERIRDALAAAKHGRINLLLHAGRGERFEEEIFAAAQKAAEMGCEIQVTADALSMENETFLKRFCGAVREAGAESLCIYDEIGYAAPTEFYRIVKTALQQLKGTAVSVKCKNDLGMAVANTLSAIKAGASMAECSVNGLGRRAGNAALEEVVMGLFARADYYDAETGIVRRLLYRTSRLAATVTGYTVPANKPIIGENALIDAKDGAPDPAGFSLIRPEDVGIFRNNLVLGTHATPKVFEQRVEELGYLLNPEQMREAYAAFSELAERKQTVADKDIEAIVAPLDETDEQRFRLLNFVINSGPSIPSTSTVILSVGGEEVVKVSTGFGPVDASFKAIDSISGLRVMLEDFSLQSVTEGEDALGDAVVKVKFQDRTFTGRGVSTDIVESAIRAYLNALNKAAAVV